MDDVELCKLFVGGISWEMTDEMLREHFGKYGTVSSSVIAKDRLTGNPRGFAFVTFSESSAVELALSHSHEIHGRMVDVKRAIPKSEQQNQLQQSRGLYRSSRNNEFNDYQSRTRKIFVGGLSPELTEEEFRNYFEKFGRITDVVVMHDNVTRRPRGFGFITFDSEDSVDEVMRKHFHELNGKLVEVKRAVPKDGPSNDVYHGSLGGGRGAIFNSYHQGSPLHYNPRFGYFQPGYGNVAGYPYGAGFFGGGYPSGGYGGIGYGLNPFVPRSHWATPTMVGVRGSLLPYGSAPPLYHPYLNGGAGAVGVPANGYSGILGAGFSGELPQYDSGNAQLPVEPTSFCLSHENVDVNSFGNGRRSEAAQIGKVNGEQVKSYPVSNSS